jgi:hypothetical protein
MKNTLIAISLSAVLATPLSALALSPECAKQRDGQELFISITTALLDRCLAEPETYCELVGQQMQALERRLELNNEVFRACMPAMVKDDTPRSQRLADSIDTMTDRSAKVLKILKKALKDGHF